MRRSLPFIAFFVSGASSLIFQTLWTRLLHHVFGATSVAISSVLTVFMAGLGLGAYLCGRYGDRLRRPLQWYALAELGVGLWALCIPSFVDESGLLATVNAWLRESLGAGSFGFMLARFACVVPVLLLPTTLMGATLPLLSRHFVSIANDPDRVGARVGTLYAVNTLGAVVGTGLGAFVLIPTVGVWATNVTAACMNLALAATLWLGARHGLWGLDDSPGASDGDAPGKNSSGDRVASTAEAAGPTAAPVPTGSALPRWLRIVAVVAFGGSGACALSYEVVWSRALAMTIGSSVHAFALILETFLIGIALGSAAMAPLLATSPPCGTPSLRAAFRASPALRVATFVGCALAPVAHANLGVRSGLLPYAAAVLTSFLMVGLVTIAGLKRVRDAVRLDPDHRTEPPRSSYWGALGVPVACALWYVVAALTEQSSYAQSALHGYLPYVSACVVTLVAGFAGLLVALRTRRVLAAAALQLYIAVATFGSYLFQDEIPYTFARMVSGLSELPDHVGTVRFFMFFTAALCTLPATLGMGAMFPLTLRIWSSGGQHVADDVGKVYASNTLGSILGAWAPGFLLMPWLGMERTLLLGILLNLAFALLLTIAEDLTQKSRRARIGLSRRGAAQKRHGLVAPRPRFSLRHPSARRPRWPTYALACTIPPLGGAMYLAVQTDGSPVRWDLSHMTLGVFRVSLANDVLDPQSWGEPDLLYYRDGVSTTVSVEKWGRHLSLKNNGKVDASNGDDMPTQIMVSAYPLLMHPQGPRDLEVALVGFGSGVTVGATLQFPIAHVDTVELEPSVVEAAVDFFHEVNHLQRDLDEFPYVRVPRLSVHADDGRNFLAASHKTYDVIISEPSNPWITGVSDLFTSEHFTSAKKRLREGGVYCQWAQLYELSPANIKTLYRTFATHFAHVVVFAAEPHSSDTILLGSDRPFHFSLERVAHAFADSRTRAELERAGVNSPEEVFARILMRSRQEVMAYARLEQRLQDGQWRSLPNSVMLDACPPDRCRRIPAPINTDDNMRIELAAPRDLIGFSAYNGYLRTFYSEDWPYGNLLTALERSPTAAAEQDARMALALLHNGRLTRAMEFASQASGSDSPAAQEARRIIHELSSDTGWPIPPLDRPTPTLQADAKTKRHVQEAHTEAARHVRGNRYPEALTALERIPVPLRTHSGPSLRLLYGYVLWRGGGGGRTALEGAVMAFEDLIRQEPDFVDAHPEIHFYAARALHRLGSEQRAVRSIRAYLTALGATTDTDTDTPPAPPPEEQEPSQLSPEPRGA